MHQPSCSRLEHGENPRVELLFRALGSGHLVTRLKAGFDFQRSLIMDASHSDFAVVKSADAARQACRLLSCMNNLSLDPDLRILEYWSEVDRV